MEKKFNIQGTIQIPFNIDTILTPNIYDELGEFTFSSDSDIYEALFPEIYDELIEDYSYSDEYGFKLDNFPINVESLSINKISEISPQFITTDGYPIYIGDCYNVINTALNIETWRCDEGDLAPTGDTFKDYEKAKEIVKNCKNFRNI